MIFIPGVRAFWNCLLYAGDLTLHLLLLVARVPN